MPENPIKIDLERSKAYAGLGDIVMLSWLAEGCRKSGRRFVVHRTRNQDLMDLLGLESNSEPGGVQLDDAYRQELSDRCRKPRLNYIRDFLNLTEEPIRPTARISTEDRDWAHKRLRELGEPPVLLFPQTAWATREWPANYWVDLAWRLKGMGIPALLLMAEKDERFTNTPLYWWGTPISRLVALIERARLVVGNDSFPAHLAGALGASTLALMGPTSPMVFAHASSVECLSSDALECTGCHFASPFRAACDQGCLSMFRLFPELVIRRIQQKLLTTPPSPTPAASSCPSRPARTAHPPPPPATRPASVATDMEADRSNWLRAGASHPLPQSIDFAAINHTQSRETASE